MPHLCAKSFPVGGWPSQDCRTKMMRLMTLLLMNLWWQDLGSIEGDDFVLQPGHRSETGTENQYAKPHAFHVISLLKFLKTLCAARRETSFTTPWLRLWYAAAMR